MDVAFRGHFQLLKSGKVDDDVCETSIVYKDSPSVEPFYHKHDSEGIVMRLLHSSGTSFENKISLSVRLCFRGGIMWMLFTCL